MSKKNVIVTGASRGIGASCARMLARAGYNVVVVFNKSEEAARDVVASIRAQGQIAIMQQADVSSLESVRRMVDFVHEELGDVNAVVNNAGIAKWGLMTDLEGEEWDELFDVNVKGMFNVCKVVIPDMIRRQNGCIVNISSICGMYGMSCEVAYSATKGAVIGFTKALSKELGPSNIRVNCVAPGFINTSMNARLTESEVRDFCENTSLGIVGQPDDIAYAVEFLLSDKSRFVTGQVISPNGGLL